MQTTNLHLRGDEKQRGGQDTTRILTSLSWPTSRIEKTRARQKTTNLKSFQALHTLPSFLSLRAWLRSELLRLWFWLLYLSPLNVSFRSVAGLKQSCEILSIQNRLLGFLNTGIAIGKGSLCAKSSSQASGVGIFATCSSTQSDDAGASIVPSSPTSPCNDYG